MTDKVQKIREEVERLRNLHQIKYQNLDTNDNMCLAECGKRNLCNDLLLFIDSLQEEPVSEGRDIFDNCLKGEEEFILPQKISGNIDCENCLYSSACALGDIQECIMDKLVSEDLEAELDKYIKDNFTIDKEQLDRFGIEEKDYMYSMDKSDMEKMVRYFTGNYKIPVSDDLEEAAKLYVSDSLCITGEEDWDDVAIEALNTYKAGAKWQMAQMMKDATAVTVHVDAGGYPYTPEIELYDYDKDIPLAKKGDRYKVILIKED